MIRSAVDTGPAKQRRRFTAVPKPVTFTLQMSEAEIAILETFRITTLQEVNVFDWIDFKTGAPATYRFMAPPTFTWDADVIWQVTFNLEQMP
jgi:hypothetical protein